MKSDDHFDIPDGDFIPGIYNYCDSWCERCIYTDKCMSFATDKLIRKEIEENTRREKSMEENKDFWEQVNNTIKDAAELIDEEIPLINTNNPLIIDLEEEEDASEAMKDYREKKQKAKNHRLSMWASKYEKAVHKWFEEKKDALKQEYNSETKNFKVSYPGIEDELVLKQLSESSEVILWYHIQIWVKIQRALSSSYDEQEHGDYFNGFPKDSEGSAMVALKGINSSIGAWSYLLGKLIPEKETIKQMVRLLIRLKMELEKLFPKANEFEWPPKSE